MSQRINTPTKLNLNHHPSKMPQEFYRYAVSKITGEDSLTSISDEPGNRLVLNLPAKIIGSIEIDRYRDVVFLLDNSIRLIDKQNNTIDLLVQLGEFNFNVDYPITGWHRVVRGCEDVVYFFDHMNPDRYINISRPEKQQTNGVFDISKFSFNPDIQHSTIETSILNTGGKLRYGTYNFAIEYLSQNEDTIFITPVDIGYTPIRNPKENQGGLNIDSNLPEVGGKPLSTQSIKINVTNIPEDAALARVIVFRTTTSDGITSDAHVVGELVNMDSTDFEFIYRGFSPTNGDYLVNRNSYLQQHNIYESSLHGLHVEGRQLRYNLKESIRDYSNYQEKASKVCAKYVVDSVPKDDPNLYLLNRTFLGGEIILPYINYVHRDGTISRSFPLVGRSKQNSDSNLVDDVVTTKRVTVNITNVNVGDDVYFDYEFDSVPDNWQFEVHYTNQQSQTSSNLLQSGSLAFDFNGGGFGNILIYLITPQGRTQIGFVNNGQELTGSFNITIEESERWLLEDTSIPDTTSIDGYYASGEFGYYEISQQYVNPPNYCGNDYWGVDCEGNQLQDTPVRLFVVPDRSKVIHEDNDNIYPIGIYFDNIEYPNTDIVGHYFSVAIIESNIVSKGVLLETFLSFDSDNPDSLAISGFYNTDPFDITTKNLATHTYISPDYLVNEEYITGEYVTVEGNYTVQDYTNPFNNYKDVFHSSLSYNEMTLYSNQNNINTYQALTNQSIGIEKSLSINPRTQTDNITNYSLSNPVQFIETNTDLNGTRYKYISVKNSLSPITNIWSQRTRRITNLNENISFNGDNFISEFRVDNIADSNVYKRGVISSIFNTNTSISVQFETLRGFFIESKVNNYLRFNGTSKCNTTYQVTDDSFSLIFDKVTERFETKLRFRDSICKFFGGYNPDYSYIQQLNRYTPLRFTYDFCSDCTGIYPNRIIFSKKSFQNDLSDNLRIFRPNDFIDIPSDTGSIIGVDYKDNKLIVRTEQSCYFIQPNNQELQLSASTVNIGTGDFLSIPAQELNTVKQGYGGQQHKLDSINTEHGLIWSDRQRGEIYQIGGSFKELTTDMYPWFNNKLPLNPNNHLIFTYDNQHKRLLITKLNEWTMSYCFRVNGWKSWHHYIPDWYLKDIDTFYSVYTNNIYKHDNQTKNVFYNLNFDSTIEFIIRDTNTFRPYSVYWFGDTFDHIVCYNNNQSTGKQILNLTVDDNIFIDNESIDLIVTDDNHKASPIKDMATSNIVWDTDISSIKQGLNQGYADQIPIIDINKPLVEQGDFNNKWFAVRLIKDTSESDGIIHWYETYDLYSIR